MARSSAKRVLGTLLFVAALVVFLAFTFLLFADAENIDDVPGVGEMDPVALGVAIILGVVALLMILLLVVRSYDKKQKETDEAEAFFVPEEDREQQEADATRTFDDAFRSPTPELVVYDLARLEPEKRAWGDDPNGLVAYHFPRNIQAGVYANDYIDISNDQRLKLRTLLAGPADLPLGRITIDEPGQEEGAQDAPVEQLPGDDFMAELEQRYESMKDTGDYDNFQELEEPEESGEPAPADEAMDDSADEDDIFSEAENVYYDYVGDVDDVVDVEGIGPVYAEKLAQVGVRTTPRLCYEDADDLAQRLGVDAKRVRTWQSMAELMKVSGIGGQYAEALARAGIEGIAELKKRSAARIADQVNEYLDTLETHVLGSKITAKRIEGWQEAAKGMRRVRTRVPEA